MLESLAVTPAVTDNPENLIDPESDLKIEERPSTAGMTSKVVKGSLWTLAGQVAPMAFSLFATPFTIRLLGAEGYGVLVLVGLIPSYLAFADFGMGLGSTKFGSEAYAEGNSEREGRIVRTAALIAFLASLPFGIGMFALSNWVVRIFNVPEYFLAEASLALKFAAVTFVVTFLNNIFNTPQLTRLRMDLNTLVGFVPKVLGIIAVPIVIYVGGGIVGATAVLMAAALLTLAGHLYVSNRLLPSLADLTIERAVVRPLLKFGSAYVVGGVAAVLLVNLEKLVLARVTSVEVLAYYSVAFNFAMMATMFSGAMLQSLIPAFSQLMTPDRREQLNTLFSRALRINIIGILPILTGLFVIARPLFTIWAGPDFGRESTFPFYVLLGGLFFNMIAYIPASLLMAAGRTDLQAKLYWIELFPYLALIAFLTWRFGAVGAAAAWSIRVFADAIAMALLAKRAVGLSIYPARRKAASLTSALLILVPPLIMSALNPTFPIWLLSLLAASLSAYAFLAWKKFLKPVERTWLLGRLTKIAGQWFP